MSPWNGFRHEDLGISPFFRLLTCFLIITSRFQMVEKSSRVGIQDQTRFFFQPIFSGFHQEHDVHHVSFDVELLRIQMSNQINSVSPIFVSGRLTDLTDPLPILTETRFTADLAKRCVFQILWSWEAGRLHAMPRLVESSEKAGGFGNQGV